MYITVKIVEKLRFNSEYAVSAVNSNANSQTSNVFFDHEGDIAIYHAMRHNLSYSTLIGNIGATYERIAPNYSTAGVYYMLNDFQNITANFSTKLKSVNIAIDGGFQNDDLEKQKNATTTRVIFSSVVSTAIGERWNVNANVSNIQSYLHIRDIYKQLTQTNEFQNLDTLEYTQLNLTTGMNVTYQLQSNEQQRQSISTNFLYQRAAEIQQNSDYRGNNIYNGVVTYVFSHIPTRFNAYATVSYNYNHTHESFIGTASYSLSLQKTFWEHLQGMLAATYSNMAGVDEKIAKVLNFRMTGGYSLQKKHNFSLSLIKIRSASNAIKYDTYTANLGYSYTFGITVARNDNKLSVSGRF